MCPVVRGSGGVSGGVVVDVDAADSVGSGGGVDSVGSGCGDSGSIGNVGGS